jgi:two-component system, NtrC family, nitrogen regulation sensor histidine kinase NtrY
MPWRCTDGASRRLRGSSKNQRLRVMTLKLKFILFIAVIHSVAIAMSYLILKEHKLFFIASELLILGSLIISWSLYNDLIQPLQRLMTGVNAIKDKDFTVKFLKTNDIETDSLIHVYNAMIDQLRTEKTQQEAQHYFLEKLVTTSPTGILILDFDNKVADLNPKCAEIIGLTKKELIGASIYSFDNYLLKTIAQLETGDSKTINLNSAKTFKCAKAHFIDRGFPRYFIMIEELTAEILAAEKKAYGKVIRMMAHEVNNSIGAVNSILDTTIQLNEASKETNDALQIAFERNEHLSDFMRNFADVIRLPLPNITTLNINELVLKIAQLMAFKAAEKGIVFQLELSNNYAEIIKLQFNNSTSTPADIRYPKSDIAPPLSIKADFNLMEQVLINIIKNAMEAIGENGVITFRTTAKPLQLCIEDTGRGITKTVENQLFTPFFTTKPYGQGVGLTLIREVLTAHNFDFALFTEGPVSELSERNVGENKRGKTVFRIRF